MINLWLWSIFDYLIIILMQNFSIADYCYERVDKIKAFNDYIGEVDDAQSNPISSLRSKKRRTTSFRRYSIPRKRRLVAADVFKKHRYSNITRCRKHIRRFALKSKQSKSYRRLETNGNTFYKLQSKLCPYIYFL